jgi:hypothetical protein
MQHTASNVMLDGMEWEQSDTWREQRVSEVIEEPEEVIDKR